VSLSDSRFIRDGERVSLHGPWKAVQAYRGLEGRVFAFVSHLGWATERVSLHGPWKAVQAYRGLEGRVFAFVSHLGWATEGVSLHGPWKAVQASPQQQ
jgi:L-rhamnose isomerase